MQRRANPTSPHSYRLHLRGFGVFVCSLRDKRCAAPTMHTLLYSLQQALAPYKHTPQGCTEQQQQSPPPLSIEAYTCRPNLPKSLIMSAGVKFSTRYLLARVGQAVEAMRRDLPVAAASTEPQSLFQRFQEAYKQQMTSVMAITGAAMAPALNPGWC